MAACVKCAYRSTFASVSSRREWPLRPGCIVQTASAFPGSGGPGRPSGERTSRMVCMAPTRCHSAQFAAAPAGGTGAAGKKRLKLLKESMKIYNSFTNCTSTRHHLVRGHGPAPLPQPHPAMPRREGQAAPDSSTSMKAPHLAASCAWKRRRTVRDARSTTRSCPCCPCAPCPCTGKAPTLELRRRPCTPPRPQTALSHR